MGNLFQFSPKAVAHATPRHLLRDMARLGATLLYVVEADSTRIDFMYAAKHTARVHSLMKRFDDCGETWHIRYLADVMNLLHLDFEQDELPVGTCLRLKLAESFVDPFPDNGLKAMHLVLSLNRQINEVEWPRRDPVRIGLINRRNDLILFLQNEAGDQYRMDAAAAASLLMQSTEGAAI